MIGKLPVRCGFGDVGASEAVGQPDSMKSSEALYGQVDRVALDRLRAALGPSEVGRLGGDWDEVFGVANRVIAGVPAALGPPVWIVGLRSGPDHSL